MNGVKLPPGPDQSVVAEVSWRQDNLVGPLLLEPDPQIFTEQKVEIADALVSSSCAGTTKVVLTNYLGFSQELEAGMEVGTCRPVEVIDHLVPKLGSGSGLECAGMVGAVVAEDGKEECQY